MENNIHTGVVVGWLFGILVFTIGVLNLFLVHAVPGLAYLLLSLIYVPPVNNWLVRKVGFSIPLVVKIILGIIIIWFTLGVSDLGDMMDGAKESIEQRSTN